MSVGLFWMMAEYDHDPIQGVLALARADEINFGVANEPGCFSLNY